MNLQPSCKRLGDAWQLQEPNYGVVWDVSDVHLHVRISARYQTIQKENIIITCLANERDHVVFTETRDFDVLYNDDFVVLLVEVLCPLNSRD